MTPSSGVFTTTYTITGLKLKQGDYEFRVRGLVNEQLGKPSKPVHTSSARHFIKGHRRASPVTSSRFKSLKNNYSPRKALVHQPYSWEPLRAGESQSDTRIDDGIVRCVGLNAYRTDGMSFTYTSIPQPHP